MKNSPKDNLNRIRVNGIDYITEGSFSFDNNGFIELEDIFDKDDTLKDFIAVVEETPFYKEGILEILKEMEQTILQKKNCQIMTVSIKNRFDFIDLEE
jgi:hypothetical protein